MKVTAREAAVRLNVSYVVAAGLLSHLEEIGRAKVVEKRFHASGKGKPTRVYEVEQNVALDFGAEGVVAPAVPVAAAAPTMEDVVESKVEERMAALARLKSATEPVAVETPVVETPVVETPVVETPVVETPVVETPVVETPVAAEPVAEETDDDDDDDSDVWADDDDDSDVWADDEDEDEDEDVVCDDDDDDDDYDADEAA